MTYDQSSFILVFASNKILHQGSKFNLHMENKIHKEHTWEFIITLVGYPYDFLKVSSKP